MNTFKLWKNIIVNPFQGFRDVNDQTKLALPLITIILLMCISFSILIPVYLNDSYGEVLARIQYEKMVEDGNAMSLEQMDNLNKYFQSSAFNTITIVSVFVGGVIFFLLIIFLTSFILKLVATSLKKEKVKFSLILKIILFASIVSMVQMILKNSITITGDWLHALKRAKDTFSFQLALQTPLSFAALVDPSKSGKIIYFLVDYLTDIFNWLYYIFFYAGLKIAVKLEKKHALTITIIIAVISLLIGLIPQLL